MFLMHKGNELQAVVEFAPYQKLPLEKKKLDSRNAIINQVSGGSFNEALRADQLLEMLASKDESKEKVAGASSVASEVKPSGDSTAPLGKPAAKRATATTAAPQKASAQVSSTTRLRTGNASAAPPVAKPSPSSDSSPSRGKSGRGSKHQPKTPFTSLGQAASTAPSSSTPPTDSRTSMMPAPAPSLAPASSDGSGRRSRPAFGLVSRQFEATLSGAGVIKGGNRWERAAEKEKEKEREPAKDGPSSSEREGGGRRKEHGARARGGPAAAPQLGIFSAPTILQRETEQSQPCPSRQGPPADATLCSTASVDVNPPTSTSRGHGRRGRGRDSGGNRRGAPPPTDS